MALIGAKNNSQLTMLPMIIKPNIRSRRGIQRKYRANEMEMEANETSTHQPHLYRSYFYENKKNVCETFNEKENIVVYPFLFAECKNVLVELAK